MGDLLQPTNLMIIGILLLVLFGAKKLPELGRGLGDGLKGFKDGLKGLVDSDQLPASHGKGSTLTDSSGLKPK